MTRYAEQAALMAIGDSLYQGVRSLTFTGALGRFSPPAQVAAALGLPMTAPNPRLPFLFDLEQLLRGGALLHVLAAVRQSALANMQFWLSGEAWSQHEAFDNVSVGGATIASLYTDTFDQYWPSVATLTERLRASPLPDPAVIGQLWFALNTCFTLNPQRSAAQGGKTQLDQVADRKPRTLLVNIGSNEGLFHAAFVGAFDQQTLQSVREVPTKMAPLIDRLAALPPEIETIAFNSLIRPRCASNLMTREDFPGFPGDAYFPSYVPRIGNQVHEIPGATVKAFDELIAGVNDQMRAMVGTKLGARGRFVDLYAASTAFDGKHYEDRYLEVTPEGSFHRLRNVPINTLAGDLIAGGLTGLDNMHPSVPGYAVIADAVLAALGNPARTDKNRAFENDTLLSNLPFLWSISLLELGLLGAAGVFGGDDQDPAPSA